MASGSRLTSIAGLNSRRLRSQSSHRSRCRLTRPRGGAVRSPSRRSRISARSGQCSDPGLLTSSMASDVSNLERARNTRASAFLRGTPSASARSAPSRPWRKFSSMISRSAGFSLASAARTTARSSARPSSAPASPVSSAISATSSSGANETSAGSRPWHSLRATANSHARRRSGSRSPEIWDEAMIKVSCTASAASAGSVS